MARPLPPEPTASLSERDARLLLARAQRLARPERDERAAVSDVVRAVGGIQAQDVRAASLGIRARLAGCTASEVAAEEGVVRAWAMRGTLHLIAADDFHWLVGLLGPMGLARGRARRDEMGVSSPAAVSAVRAALADGPLTRRELAAAVRARGVPISSDPQAPIHLVMCSALEGHVLQAGAKAGEPVYGLAVDRLGPAPRRFDREAALLELARRHVRAFPPSGPEDFAAWSGLGLADARRAFARLAGSFVEVQVRGRRALVPAGLAPAEPHVRLLPAFDSALLGHRDRALTVRPEHGRSVLPGGGVLRPTLMVDGLVEGTWRLRAGVADVSPFAEMALDVAAAVTAEVADVARHRAS